MQLLSSVLVAAMTRLSSNAARRARLA
jgi:hypothetical protein